VKKEKVDTARMSVPQGEVEEVTSVKLFGTLLSRDEELYRWWRVNMGYQKHE
jgi:hypothetical protein